MGNGLFPATEQRVGRWIGAAAQGLALAGGLLLAAVACMVVVSVLGRRLAALGTGLGVGPVTGDYELVAAGCGIAVFAFLPWCQFNRGNVTVDIFASLLPARGKAALGLVGDALIAVAAYVILWRFYLGFAEKFPHFSSGLRDALAMGPKPFFAETTYELEIPVWIPFGLSLIGAALFLVVSAYTVWRSLNWVLAGHEPPMSGVDVHE